MITVGSVTIPVRPPNGLNEIIATYGDPQYHAGNVDPHWESQNLVMLHGLPLVAGGKLYVHKLVALPLQLALADCERIGGYELEHVGCFNPRAQRGASADILSTHTWAIAIDINPDRNPLITGCPVGDPRRSAEGACDIPPAWIAAFKARGFFWGGDFSRRFDPQHFQLCTGY